jgi:predicted nucleotidyltransferase
MFQYGNNLSLVMGHFFLHPLEEFTVTEVAKRSGLSKATASRMIEELRRRGMVRVEEFGKAYRVRADSGSEGFRREKIAANLGMVLRSGIIDHIVELFQSPKAIVLFGSFRKGEDVPGSDIDIAVEVPEGGKTGIFEPEEFRDFEKKAERKVTVHAFSRKEIDKNVFENIANGFVLFGFLEVSK